MKNLDFSLLNEEQCVTSHGVVMATRVLDSRPIEAVKAACEPLLNLARDLPTSPKLPKHSTFLYNSLLYVE
jgi:hypothetical protein